MSLISSLHNLKIVLPFVISIVLPEGLVELNTDVLIGLALDLAQVADCSLLVGDLLGGDYDLLAHLVFYAHSKI